MIFKNIIINNQLDSPFNKMIILAVH